MQEILRQYGNAILAVVAAGLLIGIFVAGYGRAAQRYVSVLYRKFSECVMRKACEIKERKGEGRSG